MDEAAASYGSPELFYRDYYSRMSGNGSFSVRMVHRTMERPWRRNVFPVVLEVGSGKNEHRQHVRHRYSKYLTVDLRIWGLRPAEYCSDELTEPDRASLATHTVADATVLPFADQTVDRLIAMCLLIHLPNPEAALEEWRRVLKPGGVASIYVPCDPGLAMRTIRRFTAARTARRLGFPGYNLMISREHINNFMSLDAMVNWVFRNDRVSVTRRPLGFRSWNLNAFFIYQITKESTSQLHEPPAPDARRAES
jgi:phosphatidylethanolamine/phosphatidyl-N-methylethanolamine N-methyltransferase